MTRSIPSSPHFLLSDAPATWPHRPRPFLDKIALGNSNRFIELQTPHFANRSESHTCKLPGGIDPNSLQTVRMVSRPSIRRPFSVESALPRFTDAADNSTNVASQEVGLVSRTLSHYRIIAAIGAGGMGEVYRATDTK